MRRRPSHVSHVRSGVTKISVRKSRAFRVLKVNFASQMSVPQPAKLMHVLFAQTASTSCKLAKHNVLPVRLVDSATATPLRHNSAQAADLIPFRTPRDKVRVSLAVKAITQPVQWRRQRV